MKNMKEYQEAVEKVYNFMKEKPYLQERVGDNIYKNVDADLVKNIISDTINALGVEIVSKASDAKVGDLVKCGESEFGLVLFIEEE